MVSLWSRGRRGYHNFFTTMSVEISGTSMRPVAFGKLPDHGFARKGSRCKGGKKVIFLPPNTTSKLQPLDLGIIQNFKVHYPTLFLHFVLSKIDVCETASEITNSVTILHAIRLAWEAVKPDTIKKCFRKASIWMRPFQS